MESPLPAGLFFESRRPAALHLPHLVTALDAELIGKLTQLTKSRPGLWNVPAPFDANDTFDNLRDAAPLSLWTLPLNQGEVQAFSPLVTEAIFGVKLMFVDSAANESLLAEKAVLTTRRLETGAYITGNYQDLPTLPEILEGIGWALIPIGPERSRAVFITRPTHAALVTKMEEWCEREGRNFATVALNGETLVLREQTAAASFRENAIAHRIDALLGDLESYFGGVEEDQLLPLIQQRIDARRKLRQELSRDHPVQPPA